MAVLVDQFSVVIQCHSIERLHNNGWLGFKSCVPNSSLCSDSEIASISFADPCEVEPYVKQLEAAGLRFIAAGSSRDIAVVSAATGLQFACTWLDFGYITLPVPQLRVAACRLRLSKIKEIALPTDWTGTSITRH
jgi:hypothetical protein